MTIDELLKAAATIIQRPNDFEKFLEIHYAVLVEANKQGVR